MWSGGKDSALALQRARANGIEVARLITFHDAATGRVRFHATRVEMVQAQAIATGQGVRTRVNLRRKHGGERWRKMKGLALIRAYNGEIYEAEISV